MNTSKSCANDPKTCKGACVAAMPAGPNHQMEMIEAIEYVLKMPASAFKAFARGNAFNKMVRNYQYWYTSTGCDPYSKLLAETPLFRRSKDAVDVMKTSEFKAATSWSKSGVHPEHAVPIGVVVEELKRLRKIHCDAGSSLLRSEIERIVRMTEIVLISRDEQKRLDGKKGVKFIGANGNTLEGLGFGQTMPKVKGREWTFSDCHLARIWEIADQVIGTREI